MQALKKMNPTVRILIALLLGLVVGLIFQERAAVLQPIGDIFLNLIKMLVIPLVMCSIINSTSNMKDIRVMGRVGGKTIALYVLTTAASAAMAVLIGTAAKVGQGVTIQETAEAVSAEAPTLLGILKGMVPSNIVTAMNNFDTLPCIVFSILFGIAMVALGDAANPVKVVVASAAEIMYKLVSIIVKVAPIGVFALIASGIGQNGPEVFTALGFFCILHYVCGAVLIVLYILLVRFGGGMSPVKFVKAASKVFITAFTTRSSAATLPVTIKTAVEELGVNKDLAEFSLPIGCTINMNGNAIAMGLSAVLASFMYNSPLTFSQIAIAIAIATISSVGMPGVPNSGMIFNIFMFTSLGFPAGALVAMIASVESLTDMLCTACNVTGDVVCAILVNRSEKKRLVRKGIATESL